MQLTGEKLEEHLRESIKDFPDQSPSWQTGFCRAMLIAKTFIDSQPSTPSPVMEWTTDGVWDFQLMSGGCKLAYIDEMEDGDKKYWFCETLSQLDTFETDEFEKAKLWVEQTVSAELRSLTPSPDGRILQAVKEGKEFHCFVKGERRTIQASGLNRDKFLVFNNSNMENLYSGTDPNTALDHLLGETK